MKARRAAFSLLPDHAAGFSPLTGGAIYETTHQPILQGFFQEGGIRPRHRLEPAPRMIDQSFRQQRPGVLGYLRG